MRDCYDRSVGRRDDRTGSGAHEATLPRLRGELARRPFGAASLFRSELVEIGVASCAPDHEDFARPGPVGRDCFLFPHSMVRVRRPGKPEAIAGTGEIVFHVRGQEVERAEVDAIGDEHTWFALSADRVHSIFGAFAAPGSANLGSEDESPFRADRGPCDARARLAQELLVRHLLRTRDGGELDPLWVEEATVRLLAHAAGLTHDHARARRWAVSSATFERWRELCDRTKVLLADPAWQSASLAAVAREVRCSEFHLTRAFGRVTGLSLHRYRNRVKLVRALARLLDGGCGLAELAKELGFSSHSHLTHAFRSAFSVTPSRVRRAQTRRSLADLIEELVASLGSPDPRDSTSEVRGPPRG